ncbi:CBN-RNR-2 protein, partial [Aphelenchoides avenae]
MSYKKIDALSESAVSSSVDLFSVPATNVTDYSSSYREILTLNPVESPPFHFKIWSGSDFLDLSKTQLLVEMKIQKKDADGKLSNPAATAKVTTIQGIGSTFIQNMRTVLNGREVFNSNGLYAYKAYLDTELSYPAEVKKSYMTANGWYHHDESQTDANDAGMKKRISLFKDGQTVQFLSPIHADLFNQDRYLVSNVEMDIEITPHKSNFTIMNLDGTSTDRYELVITAAKLYVKSHVLNDALAMKLAAQLDKTPAKYPVKRADLKSEFISSGRMELNTSLFSDTVPQRAFVAFAKGANFKGDQKTSPFQFEHLSIREVHVMISGQNVPNVLYSLRWTGNTYTRAFHDLHEVLGVARTGESNGLTMEKYKNGWTVFGFNLTPSQDNLPAYDLIK